MRNSALQERRNRQILADIVRVYIETGEPVSSRAISKGFEESLSTATIRNVMADLEDGGFLYQPHTSAGRVPTAAAYRFFAQEIASQATITAVDRERIQREMGGATSAAEITERAGHVLAEVSNGLGIIVSPPLAKAVLEHARMRSEEHTSELQSRRDLVCRLLLEKKKHTTVVLLSPIRTLGSCI